MIEYDHRLLNNLHFFSFFLKLEYEYITDDISFMRISHKHALCYFYSLFNRFLVSEAHHLYFVKQNWEFV